MHQHARNAGTGARFRPCGCTGRRPTQASADPRQKASSARRTPRPTRGRRRSRAGPSASRHHQCQRHPRRRQLPPRLPWHRDRTRPPLPPSHRPGQRPCRRGRTPRATQSRIQPRPPHPHLPSRLAKRSHRRHQQSPHRPRSHPPPRQPPAVIPRAPDPRALPATPRTLRPRIATRPISSMDAATKKRTHRAPCCFYLPTDCLVPRSSGSRLAPLVRATASRSDQSALIRVNPRLNALRLLVPLPLGLLVPRLLVS